jgi:hypothetical protein
VHAGLREQQWSMGNTRSIESRVPIVGRLTSRNALVAFGACFQIDHHRLATVIHAMLNQKLQQLNSQNARFF